MHALAIVAPGLPVPSQALTEALTTAARNAAYDGPPMELYAPEHLRREARRRADMIEEALAPAGVDTAKRWLIHLAMLVANAPKGDALDAAASMMAGYLGEFPAKAFTRRTLEGMAEASKFWPSYQDVKAHLGTFLRPVQAEIAALRSVERAPEAPPEPEPRPDPGYVREQLAALKRDLAAVSARRDGGRPKHRPLHLTPAQLVATYRRMLAEGRGHEGCTLMRLQALEDRYGLAPEHGQQAEMAAP